MSCTSLHDQHFCHALACISVHRFQAQVQLAVPQWVCRAAAIPSRLLAGLTSPLRATQRHALHVSEQRAPDSPTAAAATAANATEPHFQVVCSEVGTRARRG
jgi:hypothetical protein